MQEIVRPDIFWYDAPTKVDLPFNIVGLLAFEFFAMHFVELKRWQDFRNPGSVDADPLFPSNRLPKHEVGWGKSGGGNRHHPTCCSSSRSIHQQPLGSQQQQLHKCCATWGSTCCAAPGFSSIQPGRLHDVRSWGPAASYACPISHTAYSAAADACMHVCSRAVCMEQVGGHLQPSSRSCGQPAAADWVGQAG
jgi:hypothetical protein